MVHSRNHKGLGLGGVLGTPIGAIITRSVLAWICGRTGKRGPALETGIAFVVIVGRSRLRDRNASLCCGCQAHVLVLVRDTRPRINAEKDSDA